MKETIAPFTIALLLPLLAIAHAMATATTPANGETLKTAPTEFTLTFNEPATLSRVTLQKTGEVDAKEISQVPTVAAERVTLPAPKLSPGEYTLRYRAAGPDGHVMPGTVKFTIAP